MVFTRSQLKNKNGKLLSPAGIRTTVPCIQMQCADSIKLGRTKVLNYGLPEDKFRQLGLPNQIVDDSNWDSNKVKQRNPSDLKSDDKIKDFN